MSAELRAQRREPCPFDDVNLGDECHLTSFLPTCRNCNNDGTRWVTVGTVEVTTMHPSDLGWRGAPDDRIAVFYPEAS